MNIYDKALTSVNNSELNAKLHTGIRKHVFLSRSNGCVWLVYQKLDRRNLVEKTEQVRCAVFMPNRGWIFTLTKTEYERFVKKTGHQVDNKTVSPLNMCQELRREWQACGGI